MSRLIRPFSTARGTTRGSYNYIIVVTAQYGTRQIRALAEATPRGVLTGDDKAAIWPFLCAASDALRGAVLAAPDAETCLHSIRSELERITALAWQHGAQDSAEMPMRGSYAGIEIALLDLGARAFDMSVAEFLGGKPRPIRVTAISVSAGKTYEERQTTLTSQARRFQGWRIKSDGHEETALDYLRGLTRTNRAQGHDHIMWLDFNQAFDQAAAMRFLDRLAAEHAEGRIAGTIMLEQPVHRDETEALSILQRHADSLRRDGLEILIMADESLHTLGDWQCLARTGACRAINIKIPKAGGLLASLEIARAALAHDPEIRIYIGGMVATSDITAWTIYNLACAMPGFRYTTTSPNDNIAVDIATVPYRFRRGEKSVIFPPEAPGLGSDVDLPSLAALVEDHHPPTARHLLRLRQTVDAAGKLRNTFVWPEAEYFAQLSIDTLLLQSAAMARGMRTLRLTPVLFTSAPPDDASFAAASAQPDAIPQMADPEKTVGFWWSAGNFASRYGIFICGNKQLTRIMLRANGVPVPQGRKFFHTAHRSAIAYAERLGWPVVVKPSIGGGGRAVTTDIRSVADLKQAIDTLNEGESFIVEEHVTGEDYRILVTEEKVISVFTRRAARVVGDGRRSIAELVARANRLREDNPRYRHSLIELDEKPVRRMLDQQGLSPDSVPGKGVEVILSPAANVSQGGEGMDVTAETHPSVLDFARQIRLGLPGLGHCGIDLLMEDHRKPIDEQSVGVCEVNSRSSIAVHCFPSEGRFADAGEELYLYNAWRTGLTPGPRDDLITVRIRADGVGRPGRYAQWAADIAADLGVALDEVTTDTESVAMVATGWVPSVATLAVLAITPGSGLLAEVIHTTALPARVLPKLALETVSDMTVHVILSGKVQRVGYRKWLQREARAIAINGFVRNVSDGTVEAVLSGPEKRIEALLARMREGPRKAVVQDVVTAPWTGKTPPQKDFLRYKTVTR